MNKRVKIDKGKAVELKEQGKTYAEIAEELGCSVDWCNSSLRQSKYTFCYSYTMS